MKKMFTIVSMLLMIIVIGISVQATESGNYNLTEGAEVISQLKGGDMKSVPIIENVLKYNGEEIKLYPTYNNQENAIDVLYDEATKLLTQIAVKYNLDKLTVENWKEYNNSAIEYIYNPENDLKDTDNEPSAILSFFDIYENKEKNQNIIDVVSSNTKNRTEELSLILPYDMEDNINQDDTPDLLSYNISAAVGWAEEYALVPCTAVYGYFPSGDCTNFVSQILLQGGIAENYTGNTSTGWWHRMDGNLHNYSRSWTVADTFVKYRGRTYTSGSFNDFSKQVAKGDVIAYDREKDGDWEHCGFISDVKSGTTSAGYRDFKVAQHTSNYNAWVSSSTNGWENLSNVNYSIVKR